MGILYIVATPIGNLKDITLRALEILKEADFILAEDTRVIKKLLSHYNIRKPVRRYDEYSSQKVYEQLNKELAAGAKIALVSDAGTPAISDPGAKLIQYIRNSFSSSESGPKIVAVPGPSALTAALSVSGVNAAKFIFFGYPPAKKGRQKFFIELAGAKIKPVVIYESPHRLLRTFENLKRVLGGDCEIMVIKELTKIHEEYWRGLISKTADYFKGDKLKGEFVIIIP